VGTKKVFLESQYEPVGDGFGRHGHFANTPVYEPKTVRCDLGTVTPIEPTATRAGAANFAAGLAGQQVKQFKVTPGVRINGTYPLQGGASVEIDEDSIIFKCGQGGGEYAYAVVPSGDQLLVKTDNGAVLAWTGDGVAARSGVCGMGTSSMAGASNATASEPAAGLSTSGGTAMLALASGLPANVLAGHTFGLSKQDFATVLTKMGVRPTGDTSVLQQWVQACKSQAPLCQQGFNAMGNASLKTASLDANGKGSFGDVPAGVYYVFGTTRYGAGHLLWNVRVDLAPGAHTLKLDLDDAMPIN